MPKELHARFGLTAYAVFVVDLSLIYFKGYSVRETVAVTAKAGVIAIVITLHAVLSLYVIVKVTSKVVKDIMRE